MVRVMGSCGRKGGYDQRAECNILEALIHLFKERGVSFQGLSRLVREGCQLQTPKLIFLYTWTCHDLEGRKLSDE